MAVSVLTTHAQPSRPLRGGAFLVQLQQAPEGNVPGAGGGDVTLLSVVFSSIAGVNLDAGLERMSAVLN